MLPHSSTDYELRWIPNVIRLRVAVNSSIEFDGLDITHCMVQQLLWRITPGSLIVICGADKLRSLMIKSLGSGKYADSLYYSAS